MDTHATSDPLPLGKLPFEFLSSLLARAPIKDSRVIYGPGIGLDCAVIDLGERVLVFKSDPITFASDDIGWYAVQVNANDIATTGAAPRWMLATLLLPEAATSTALVECIFDQIYHAAQELEISVVGGHTEVTYDLHRPLLVGTMIGEVEHGRLVTPDHVQPGDRLLLTKGVPIEGTALLAREFSDYLRKASSEKDPVLNETELEAAQRFLYTPGISVVRDAQIATRAGKVHAMHDPTESGLSGALWELADASHRCLVVDRGAVYVPPLARRICNAFGIDPLATIASGALLLAVDAGDSANIQAALRAEDIACDEIGSVINGPAGVWLSSGQTLQRPIRDDIARVFEEIERDQ